MAFLGSQPSLSTQFLMAGFGISEIHSGEMIGGLFMNLGFPTGGTNWDCQNGLLRTSGFLN